jgi:hypothetical protein
LYDFNRFWLILYCFFSIIIDLRRIILD